MLYVGNNFFYTKSLPCTLWFFDKGKPYELRDKVLFIDAQRYHTAVSTTLNEWTPWQLKNLSAIVWLYRGELDKYTDLLDEYRSFAAGCAPTFGDDASELLDLYNPEDFVQAHEAMVRNIERQKADAKAEVEALPKREQKKRREALARETERLEEAATVMADAVWLTEKFGLGEYADVAGLCQIASRDDIKGDQDADKSSWSLTPGAYVGVPPVEDDGVDFHERMQEIHEELLALQAESNQLMDAISKSFEEMGL